VFPAPERAVRAYRALVARARLQPAPPCPAPPARPLPPAVAAALEGEGPLDPGTARALLASHGVPVVRQAAAATLEEALSRAGEIGYPVAVKTARADVLHKTEAGGVVLGVRDADDLRAAWARLVARLGPGPVLVQELVEGGVELLVGGRRDPVFGPLVACGAGGVLAELVRDVSLRLAPVGLDAARAMLREGPKAALLGGWRGAPPADEAAVARVVVAVGDLVAGQPRVAELDVNPLIVVGGRVVAVDALVLRSGTSHG
jgi:acyl-CoA synthetase (NDP forming)